MTPDEQIEAVARAIFKRRWPDYDYDEHNRMYQAGLSVHPELYMASTTVGNALADARIAIAAYRPAVEAMVREAAVAGWVNCRNGNAESADAIVARVMQGAG